MLIRLLGSALLVAAALMVSPLQPQAPAMTA